MNFCGMETVQLMRDCLFCAGFKMDSCSNMISVGLNLITPHESFYQKHKCQAPENTKLCILDICVKSVHSRVLDRPEYCGKKREKECGS